MSPFSEHHQTRGETEDQIMDTSDSMVSSIDDLKSDMSISNIIRICPENANLLRDGRLVEYGSISGSLKYEVGSGMNLTNKFTHTGSGMKLIEKFTHTYDQRDEESEMQVDMFSGENLRLRYNNYPRNNNLNNIHTANF